MFTPMTLYYFAPTFSASALHFVAIRLVEAEDLPCICNGIPVLDNVSGTKIIHMAQHLTVMENCKNIYSKPSLLRLHTVEESWKNQASNHTSLRLPQGFMTSFIASEVTHCASLIHLLGDSHMASFCQCHLSSQRGCLIPGNSAAHPQSLPKL